MTSLMTAQSHQRELGYLQGAGKPPGSRHDSPDELKRASFHFLPDYGTILPSSGATFCHCQAQSDASGEKFREVYHRHSEYAFRLQEACFAREKPYSQFYPSPTLHLITKLIHHLCIELVIIDDRTVVYKLPIGNSKTEVTATSRRVAERIPIVG